MHVASDAVRSGNFFHTLDSGNLVGETFAIDSHNLTFFKLKAQLLAAGLFHLLQIGTFGQTFRRVENFAAANRRAPNTYVVGIFHFRKISHEAVLAQIFNFLVARESIVAGKRDDFHIRSHDKESHVETHLVVARTGRTVRDGIGTDFVGIARNGECLENTFRTYGNRICTVAEHVAIYHIAQALLVIFLCHVKRHIFCSSQLVGVSLVCLQLFVAETSGIGTSGIYLVAFFFGKIHYGV